MSRRTRRNGRAVVAFGVTLALLVTGCTSGTSNPQPTDSATPSPSLPPGPSAEGLTLYRAVVKATSDDARTEAVNALVSGVGISVSSGSGVVALPASPNLGYNITPFSTRAAALSFTRDFKMSLGDLGSTLADATPDPAQTGSLAGLLVTTVQLAASGSATQKAWAAAVEADPSGAGVQPAWQSNPIDPNQVHLNALQIMLVENQALTDAMLAANVQEVSTTNKQPAAADEQVCNGIAAEFLTSISGKIGEEAVNAEWAKLYTKVGKEIAEDAGRVAGAVVNSLFVLLKAFEILGNIKLQVTLDKHSLDRTKSITEDGESMAATLYAAMDSGTAGGKYRSCLQLLLSPLINIRGDNGEIDNAAVTWETYDPRYGFCPEVCTERPTQKYEDRLTDGKSIVTISGVRQEEHVAPDAIPIEGPASPIARINIRDTDSNGGRQFIMNFMTALGIGLDGLYVGALVTAVEGVLRNLTAGGETFSFVDWNDGYGLRYQLTQIPSTTFVPPTNTSEVVTGRIVLVGFVPLYKTGAGDFASIGTDALTHTSTFPRPIWKDFSPPPQSEVYGVSGTPEQLHSICTMSTNGSVADVRDGTIAVPSLEVGEEDGKTVVNRLQYTLNLAREQISTNSVLTGGCYWGSPDDTTQKSLEWYGVALGDWINAHRPLGDPQGAKLIGEANDDLPSATVELTKWTPGSGDVVGTAHLVYDEGDPNTPGSGDTIIEDLEIVKVSRRLR